MPILDNPRHERFAQELAKGKSQAEAYTEAGFKPNDSNCSRLNGNERIQARVAELLDRVAIRCEVTAASLIDEAEEARMLALKLGQPSAAVAAIKEKGVLAGVRIEKSERKNTNDVRRLSEDELD